MNRRMVTVLAISLAGATGPTVSGPQRFQDYASVVKVEPIVESRPVQVSRRRCEAPPRSSYAVIAARIGQDIRRQMHRWEAQPDCWVVQEQDYRERIVGYWVTYDYGGRTGVKRLSYDPGLLVPVTVSLTPSR